MKCSIPDCESAANGFAFISIDGAPKANLPVCDVHRDAAREDTHPMVQRWINNTHYQAFMRQVHVDLAVGFKNGVKMQESRKALNDLAQIIKAALTI